jgi:hypothetical protein
MLRLAAFYLCLLSGLPTPAMATPVERPAATTQRSVNAFRDCFIASQEQAKRPWAYVLNADSGGTFSTVAAADGESPYSLAVRENRGMRHVALSGEAVPGSGPTIAVAVAGCLR